MAFSTVKSFPFVFPINFSAHFVTGSVISECWKPPYCNCSDCPTLGVRQGCPSSPVLFNIFLEKIRQHPSEINCFACDEVEVAEESGIPLSTVSIRGRPLCNLLFVDGIYLLETTEEELQQLIERLEKTAPGRAWKSAPTKTKFLSTASSQDHLPIYVSMEKRWKKLTRSNAKDPHKPHKYTINKGSKDLTGATALSRDKASTPETSNQFSHKDYTVTSHLSGWLAMWMWDLDVDTGSGEAIIGFWKQVLQEDAWHNIQRA